MPKPPHPGPPVDHGPPFDPGRPDEVIIGRHRARHVVVDRPPQPEPHDDRGLCDEDHLCILRGERHEMNDDAGLPVDRRSGLIIVGDV